jgi:hypothetical protein
MDYGRRYDHFVSPIDFHTLLFKTVFVSNPIIYYRSARRSLLPQSAPTRRLDAELANIVGTRRRIYQPTADQFIAIQ